MCGMWLKVCTFFEICDYDCHSQLHLGFRKKVEALTEQKECELVGEWQCSLINHLYWCVVSTPIDEGEVIKAKWLSLDNHIHNQHSDYGELYPKCSHGELQGQDRHKWFKRCELTFI